ncbi:hypothetical protein BDC45DRAFT_515808 [Circinella umbellata]|nr:hypothetical protein BDC45DRAFT_515808 [Circinella umbellata]
MIQMLNSNNNTINNILNNNNMELMIRMPLSNNNPMIHIILLPNNNNNNNRILIHNIRNLNITNNMIPIRNILINNINNNHNKMIRIPNIHNRINSNLLNIIITELRIKLIRVLLQLLLKSNLLNRINMHHLIQRHKFNSNKFFLLLNSINKNNMIHFPKSLLRHPQCHHHPKDHPRPQQVMYNKLTKIIRHWSNRMHLHLWIYKLNNNRMFLNH